MVKKIVIAFDQSYKRTGISVGIDGKLVKVTSVDLSTYPPNEARAVLRNIATKLIRNALKKCKDVVILTERIRTQSQYHGRNGPQYAVSKDYIFKTSALVYQIVDAAAEFDLKTYSVDTRSWKAQIVGSSKAKKTKDGKRDAKGETVQYVQRLGFDLFIRTQRATKKNPNGLDIYDDDAADSACICLYGFLPASKQKLTEIKI